MKTIIEIMFEHAVKNKDENMQRRIEHADKIEYFRAVGKEYREQFTDTKCEIVLDFIKKRLLLLKNANSEYSQGHIDSLKLILYKILENAT